MFVGQTTRCPPLTPTVRQRPCHTSNICKKTSVAAQLGFHFCLRHGMRHCMLQQLVHDIAAKLVRTTDVLPADSCQYESSLQSTNPQHPARPSSRLSIRLELHSLWQPSVTVANAEAVELCRTATPDTHTQHLCPFIRNLTAGTDTRLRHPPSGY